MIPTSDYLSHLVLVNGRGSGRPGDRCAIQELRSWLDLDPCSDAIPDCVSLVIGSFVIRIQDARAEWRAQIVPILPLLISSKGDDALERRRMFRCADWAVREVLFSLLPDNEDLAGLPPIVDETSAQRAAEVCDKIYQTEVVSAVRWAAGSQAAMAVRATTTAAQAESSVVQAVQAATAWVARAVAPHNVTNNPVSFIKDLLNMV